MDSSNKISVVIPAYNRADKIGYCLESVLSQTHPPDEIIVVDDCSTDETVDKVHSFGDQRIRCIVLKENSGAQVARNRGICEATCEWIAFQDSDDEWSPQKLERQIGELKKINYDPMTVVYTDCWRFNSLDGSKVLWQLPSLNGAHVYRELLARQGPVFPTLLTSKIALEKIGLLDEHVSSYQEWDTAIRLAKHCNYIHLQEPLFTYHLHAGETISKNHPNNIRGYQYIVDKFKDEIIEYCGVQGLNNHLRNNAVRAMRVGCFNEAVDILCKTTQPSADLLVLRALSGMRLAPGFYLNTRQRIQSVRSCLRNLIR